MMLPKPARRQPKARKALRRSRAPIPRRRTLGAKRREAKAKGGVDPDTWAEICWFYRDPAGSGRILCAYCQERPATQQDHIKAIAHGGTHEPANVVPVCEPCQFRKGTQTWEPKRRHPWMGLEAVAKERGLL